MQVETTKLNAVIGQEFFKTVKSYQLVLVFNKVRNDFRITRMCDIRRSERIITLQKLIAAMDKGYLASNEFNGIWLKYRNEYKDVTGKQREIAEEEVSDENILGRRHIFYTHQGSVS